MDWADAGDVRTPLVSNTMVVGFADVTDVPDVAVPENGETPSIAVYTFHVPETAVFWKYKDITWGFPRESLMVTEVDDC